MYETLESILAKNEEFSSKEEQLRFWGEYHGYPECCITLFLQESHKAFWYNELPWYPNRNIRLDGYIPCKKCANKPRQVLVDDIKSRRKVDKIK